MTTTIATNPKFKFRLEDYVYSSIVVFGILISAFVYSILVQNSAVNNDRIIFLILFNLFCMCLAVFLIYLSFKRRLQTKYLIEDDYLIKYFNEKMIFKIAFKEIVSIRIYDKKEKEGSIIFFTNESSKAYTFAYIPLFIPVPLALYGLTKFKINQVHDRKWLVTKIYEANPKLYFIENR